MTHFASPFAFFLLLPLAAAAAWVYRRRRVRGLLYGATPWLPRHRASWRIRVSEALPALTLLGLALAVVALARPQNVLSRVHQSSDAIAIQMAVDVSGSMSALDFATPLEPRHTRLDVVKTTFADFVRARPGDLIGLVTFGGYATSRVPLTLDHDALLHALQGVQIPRAQFSARREVLNAEELATAIGDGLAVACARLRDSEVRSRVVVLLSDGESNAGVVRPEDALRLAHELHVKVYAIGVGSSGVANVLVETPDGRSVVRQSHVHIDEAFLRRAALETGGLYYNVRDPDALRAALAEIDRLERTEISRELYTLHQEDFHLYLYPGIALLLVGCTAHALLRHRVL